jgi:hypothetical protein
MRREGRPQSVSQYTNPPTLAPGLELVQSFENGPDAFRIGWSADGSLVATTGTKGDVVVWSVADGQGQYLTGHKNSQNVMALAWHPSRPLLATGGGDGVILLWDMAAGKSDRLCTVDKEVRDVSWSPDGTLLAVAESGGFLRVLEMQKGLLRSAQVHEANANSVCWSLDGQSLMSGGGDGYISVQSADGWRIIRRWQTGQGDICASLSSNNRFIATGGEDDTVRIWDFASGAEIAVLEGHTEEILAVHFSPDSRFLASAMASEDSDSGVLLWRCRDWSRVAGLRLSRFDGWGGLAFHPSKPLLAAKELASRQIDCYKVDYQFLDRVSATRGSRRYVNAKVVLVGDTGVGKSGLGLVLSGQPYRPTDSTHGRNVWTLSTDEVDTSGGGNQTRELLLWDLAGQPGYRIIHQLHLNEVAVALLVFDSRSEVDPFSGVRYWTRALAQARRLEGSAAVPLTAYLVAARADRGGVGVSPERIHAMVDDLGLDGFFETSAKAGWHVAELIQAIRDGIDWDALPIISSSTLFDAIKQFLLEEKQQSRLLSTVDDLFHGFRRAHPDADNGNLRASFETCIGRVESRGLIRRLHFGDLVLLQPELLDAYASGMVQAAKEEPDGLGFIMEEEALAGQFRLGESDRVGDQGQEKLLLIATVEELLRHEIALKEITDRGVDLVFPSQFTRERPGMPVIPGREVTFTFQGSLQSIYATLAVRLSHSVLFKRQEMWQNAASYTATSGGVYGIHLRQLEEGRGELVLFYDERAPKEVRVQFETYVANHLKLRALPGTLARRVIRVCRNCSYVLPEDLVELRLNRGAATIRCPACEESEISLVEQPVASTDSAVIEMNRRADERRDQNAATLQVKGKIETGDYDVFLCHNSRDKEQVRAIGERLKDHGILPWLDIWEIRPGTRWQKELQKIIKSVRSAAVFVGTKGAGPWQELEVESLLGQIAKSGRPLIPVILEGRVGTPRLPAFLNLWHVVDMRQPDPDPFEQLVWGITGERPSK